MLEPVQGKEAGLDASKVNDLLANVDNRLSGGLHGAFYEAGSKLESSTRHGQLEALFELKAQLSEVQGGLAKQAQRAEAENDKQTKGPGKPSGSMISTVKTIIEQQMADRLRDITIRLDRVKDTARKDQTQQQDKTDKAYEAKIKVLEKKVKQLEEDKPSAAAQARQGLQINGAVTGFSKARLDALEDCKNAHAARLHQLETWKQTHAQYHAGLEPQLHSLAYLSDAMRNIGDSNEDEDDDDYSSSEESEYGW